MKDSIADQKWVWDDATRAVFKALDAPARFVGGCVRDGWLKRKVTDIDIATPLTPDRVCERLAAAGMKPLTIGIEHGTVSVFPAPKQCFEITTLRRDITTDGRHATVAFTDQWELDACRRDFTINALYADPDGVIYDPLEVFHDLKSRCVRFIGDPRRRIEEDFLRIPRFFRFSAAYGRGHLDSDGLAACAEKKDGVTRLSGERIRNELFRAFMLPCTDSAIAAIREMDDAGVLSVALAEAVDGGYREKTKIFAQIAKTPISTRGQLVCLGSLIHDANAVADRLRLPRASRDRLCNMKGQGGEIFRDMSKHDARKMIYRIGQQTFRDRTRIARATDCIRAAYSEDRDANDAKWRDILACSYRTPPEFRITGDMVRAEGIPEGPEVGRILKAVEDWWVENDFPKKADAVARLKTVIGERGRE